MVNWDSRDSRISSDLKVSMEAEASVDFAVLNPVNRFKVSADFMVRRILEDLEVLKVAEILTVFVVLNLVKSSEVRRVSILTRDSSDLTAATVPHLSVV